MALSDAENALYQNALKFVSEITLNLMAVKVENRPEDFLGWCKELIDICRHGINFDLLEPEQFKPLKKLEETLVTAASVCQLKMTRIAPWGLYVDFIQQQADIYALEERLRLLDYIATLREKPLAEMSENDLLTFAGKHTSNHLHHIYNFDVEWFASTKGAKIFHTILLEQPADFDHALGFIPLEGDITPDQYRSFSRAYQKIFSAYTKEKSLGEKAPLAAATRLLAMRRPDQFVALTNSKIDVLCQGLCVTKFNGFDFDRYWQEMIGTIRTCAWWHQAEPSSETLATAPVTSAPVAEDDEANAVVESIERKIWKARALFLDVFLFADETVALNSNYLRLRDKKLNKSSATPQTTGKVRTKETAEMLVDRALGDDSLPEYIQGKRESIISEVKNGKSVEHVIGLMRAIFG